MNGHLISWFDIEAPTTENDLLFFINKHRMRWGRKPENILLSCKDFDEFSAEIAARQTITEGMSVIHLKAFQEPPLDQLVRSINIFGVDVQPSSIIARGIATQVLRVPIYKDLLKITKQE